MTLQQIDAAPFTKENYNISSYPIELKNPLTQCVDLVRGTVLQLLSKPNYPLNSRLFFINFFANCTLPFLSSQAKNYTESLLNDEINLLSNPQILIGLHDQFESFSTGADLPLNLPLSFILLILMGRSGEAGSFNKLLLKVWQNYGFSNPSFAEINKVTEDALDKITIDYKTMRDKTPLSVTQEFDSYLERYSQYFWFSHIFTLSPNLLIHTRRLFIPLAVEVFYQLNLGIEHSSGLLAAIEQNLDKNKMCDFEHLCLLLLI